MTIFEIVANITTGYDRNYFDWIVQLYGFDLNESNTFYFILELEGNGVYTSAFFNITSQSGSSSTTSTPTLGSTATSASVPAIVTLTLSTIKTATSSPSPASALLTGLSKETFGVVLGIGIPILIAILVTLFVLLKQKTLPDENPTKCTPRRGRPRQQIVEVERDSTYRAELSEDPNFAELPTTK